MGNIMDYIQWRGDISFEKSPFNDIDNLILSCLAYVNLDGIEEVCDGHALPIGKLWEIFSSMHTEEELQADKSFLRDEIGSVV